MPTTTHSRFPGLQRLEYPERAIACFRVRLQQRSGETVQEYFPFRKFRGEAKALAAARRRWRELRQISPRLSRQEYAEVERRPSASGIVGVTRVTKERKGREYDFWCASYTGRDGVKRMRVFSVGKYGEKPAKDLAVAARQEGLAELAGRRVGGRVPAHPPGGAPGFSRGGRRRPLL